MVLFFYYLWGTRLVAIDKFNKPIIIGVWNVHDWTLQFVRVSIVISQSISNQTANKIRLKFNQFGDPLVIQKQRTSEEAEDN